MDLRLAGKRALVTGSSSGIGTGIAKVLAAEGAAVVVHGRNEERTERVRAELEAAGAQVASALGDLATDEGSAAVAEAAVAAFGGIDILVNNAAYFSSIEPTPFEEIDPAAWRRAMDVNTLGVFLACRACVPEIKRRGAGRIINLASGAPIKGLPFMLHYVTSKGAVIALTRALARELGPHNITVNALAPGFTLSENVLKNTEHVARFRDAVVKSRAIQRDEYPDDLVGAASFLASDDAAFMTGQTVVVDGGSAMV
jgi:NAD(P)-dependent dehydrogenase (short-subunit alcohol dehydrogenase family)